jgi:hypothetical protein
MANGFVLGDNSFSPPPPDFISARLSKVGRLTAMQECIGLSMAFSGEWPCAALTRPMQFAANRREGSRGGDVAPRFGIELQNLEIHTRRDRQRRLPAVSQLTQST